MKIFCSFLSCYLGFFFLVAEGWDSFSYFPPMDLPYHPISTKNKEAQKAFDIGLTAIYAFNYDAAVRNFDKAMQLDPDLAMAYWGLALALDENLDAKSTAVHARLTFSTCQKAVALSQNATPKERAYIHALERRFSDDPNADKNNLRKAYSSAMRDVVTQYPDDLDAAILYAESLMDLLFWDLWKSNKEPYSETKTIISSLESVLKRDPLHLGANHYYIHAVENSSNPEKGLMAAYRLYQMDLPDWGHLLHTPSHIFMRVGAYSQAVSANQRAVEADQEYIKMHGIEGRYPLKFYSHALSYLTLAYLWQERFSQALATAQELENLARSRVKEYPYLEYTLLWSLKVYLYFHRWTEIINLPEPSPKLMVERAFWSFAQAMAYVSLGQMERAKELQQLFSRLKQSLVKGVQENEFVSQFFDLAENLLIANFYRQEGNFTKAIYYLEQAVEKQTDLIDLTWFYPICQTLGAVLVEAKKWPEAEQLFRKALEHVPRNGRLLFGLSQVLELQGKNDYSVTRECKEALKYATQELTLKDL